MDERDRLGRLGSQLPPSPLHGDDARERVVALGKQAVERWYAAQGRLGVEWPFTGDFRTGVCPAFELDPEDAAVAATCRPAGMRHDQTEIPALFLAWRRCPATESLPNPYDSLIALWEGGGGFRREGSLWELSSADGPCGGLGWPTARPVFASARPGSDMPDKNGDGSVVPPHLAGKFTPEQWARQQAFADRMRRASTNANGRPLRAMAAKARRILVFGAIGVGFLLAGVSSLTSGTDITEGAPSSVRTPPRGLVAVLGPRGIAILFVLLGLAAIGYAGRTLFNASRGAKPPRD